MKKLLYGGTIVLSDRLETDKALLFDDTILSLVDKADWDRIKAEKIYFSGYVLPGLIDLHLHGAMGVDVSDGTDEALSRLQAFLPGLGTTSFLATTMSLPLADIHRALECVRRANNPGARILGVHLEGPFLNPKFRGVQDERNFLMVDPELFCDDLDLIKILTYAPECDPGLRLTRALGDRVVLSLGHSAASYELAKEALQSGARSVTHCFNAMSGLHHREPGLAGAALMNPCHIEMIADGVHVHPDLLEFALRAKAPEERILVTDSIRAAGLSDGDYTLGGLLVQVQNGIARDPSGRLAGSLLTPLSSLRNMLRFTSFSLPEIVAMWSLNPAKLIGEEARLGQIKAGLLGDLLVLNKDFELERVYLKGVEYARP